MTASRNEATMPTTIRYIPSVLYLVVAVVCLVMARKSILARRIIPFHETAAGKPWEDMEEPLRQVVLTLTRTTGFGFLAVGLLLIATCAAAPGHPGAVLKYGSPGIALTYCLGIFWSTYRLYQATRTPTPWKSSLAAAVLLLAAMAVSSVLG
jgi:hypothetical protein